MAASNNTATSMGCRAVAPARILAARSRLKAKFAGSRRFRQRSAVESDDRSATGRVASNSAACDAPASTATMSNGCSACSRSLRAVASSVTSIARRPSKRLLEAAERDAFCSDREPTAK